MATTTQNQNLCDYCHQKPKFSNHNYCGKTCSQQAAAMNQTNAVPAPAPPQPQAASTLCKQCNQKPKFQNFEFCGKNCAATWQLAHGSSNGTANPPTKKPTGNVIGQVLPNVQIPPQLLGQIPQPLQAHLQAILPALAVALQQQGNNQPQQQQQQAPTNLNVNVNNVPPVPPSTVSQQSTAATSLATSNQNANPPQANVNQNLNGASGPSLPVPQNAQGPANGTTNGVIPTGGQGQVQTTVPTTCRLNGCSKPVYTDAASNHASEYCSKRHREEAVTTGQAKACIRCLKMPRGTTDHFCSKVCREAALNP